MAVSIFNSLIFGNIDSADYGIYITGESVYDAPERAVEMVKVPGRNGAIALDLGRWENVEVSYPAGCFGDDQSDFASKISDFRNAIVSQIGYQRLTDTYNPNEYRLGVYASGLDVKPASMNRAGEFTISFDCKPQRFLTSGETETIVASGTDITNPTQYDSRPLLKVSGRGDFTVNGYPIKIIGGTFGDTVVAYANSLIGEKSSMNNTHTSSLYIEPIKYNEGDNVKTASVGFTASCKIEPTSGYTVTKVTSSASGVHINFAPTSDGGGKMTLRCSANANTIATGTSSLEYFVNNYITVAIHYSNSTTDSENVRFSVSGNWYESSFDSYEAERIQFTLMETTHIKPTDVEFSYSDIIADSSKIAYGAPTYIDCETGEAYMINTNGIVSLNRYVVLGSDLPVLSPGANRVTFSSPITQVKIVPRWWKL